MPYLDNKPERPSFVQGCLPILMALIAFAALALFTHFF